MNIMHSSRNDCWYTPLDIVQRVKQVLGEIELSPASDSTANQRFGARRYITQAQNGLATDWALSPKDSVYLNPPGGKVGNKSLSGLFWTELMKYRPTFGHAIYMAFSVEQLAVSQKAGQLSMMDFTFCVPAKRIQFDLLGARGLKTQPSHSNAIVYVPSHIDKTDLFVSVFSDLGRCR